MCLIIWSSCASGDMSKCDKCGKLCTGSHVGQVWMVVQDLETWVCNNCAIPPPNYPPPALVNLPDDQKEEDIVEEKDPPPPSHPPARTEVKCHKLNAVGWRELWMPNAETQRIDAMIAAEDAACRAEEAAWMNDDKKDDQKEDDMDGNNDDTKIEDLVNLI